uniref:Tetraspanin-33 n=1 Tax=Calidris pygmaea TaxID=425635 RepID=A0A8C3JC29_9CHAR
MARRAAAAAGGRGAPGEDFSFVSPAVKYVLFFFNTLFWMISMVMVAVGVYARLLKHAEAALGCLAVDPAILLVVVGVLTFLITFCGCVGSLRENICLLQTFSVCLTIVFLLQLAAGVLGFVFSDKVPQQRWGAGRVLMTPQPVPLGDNPAPTVACPPRRHAGRSARSSTVPSCITGMTWTCRTSSTLGRRRWVVGSAGMSLQGTRTWPHLWVGLQGLGSCHKSMVSSWSRTLGASFWSRTLGGPPELRTLGASSWS